MKIFLKLISLLLVTVLLLCSVTACKKKETEEKKNNNHSSSVSDDAEDTDDSEEIEPEEQSYDDYEDYDDYEEEYIEEASKLTIDTTAENFVNSMYTNVKIFGVNGDGVTDDTDALQKAINASNGSVLYFPEGTYLISKPIIFGSETMLVGEGLDNSVGGKAVLKAKGDLKTLLTSESIKNAVGVYFCNLTFDGSSNSGISVENGINFFNARNSRMYNCRFVNFSNCALNCDYNSDSQRWVNFFDYLHFENVKGYAFRICNTDSHYSHIYVDGGKGIHDFQGGGNTFSDICVKNSTGNGFEIGREGAAVAYNIALRDCTFINNAGYGVSAVDAKNYYKRFDISNCYFENNGLGDITIEKSQATTVSNCVLKSKVPVYTNESYSYSFMYNDVAVNSTSFLGSDASRYYSYGNNFGATDFKNAGYMSDNSTQIKNSQNIFDILGGSYKGEYVNVNDCGEPENDDWGKIFNIAVAKVAKTGGVVYCPNETYNIGTTVVVPSNVYILGHGRFDVGQFVSKGNLDTMFVVHNAENSGFINFNICDVGVSSSVPYGGVYLMNCKNCLFYNCILSAGDSGKMPYVVNIDSQTDGTIMQMCKFGSAAEGKAVVLCRGNNGVFRNNYCTGGPAFIIKDCVNNVLQSCHFECCTSTHITIKGDKTANVFIRGNYLDVNACSIRILSSVDINRNVQITSNAFRTDARRKDDTTGLNPPDIIISSANGINVFANTFEQGLAVLTLGTSSNNSTFMGNMLTNRANPLFAANAKDVGSSSIIAGNMNSKE